MLNSAVMDHRIDVNSAGAASPSRRPLRSYYLVWIVLALALVLDLGLGWWLYLYKPAPPEPAPAGVQTFTHPEAAPSFNLTDQNGLPYSEDRLQGKWTIMMFGYTHCPDFCPTTLTALNRFYHRLNGSDPRLAADTQVLFVSVDPFRDTQPVLADFIGHFNAKFIAATGAPEQLQRLTLPLGASYGYADPASGEPLNGILQRPLKPYGVNHSAGLYVFDAQARNVALLLPPFDIERLDSVYHYLRKRDD